MNGLVSGPSTVTYTTPAGCTVTKPITVNPLPNPIGGSAVVCQGLTTTLTEITPGGTWSSNDVTTASVSGPVVFGNAAGNAFISYTLPTSCYVTIIATVNASPAPITGATSVCAGSQTALSSPTPGGTWSSTVPGNASVNSSGIVTGITPSSSATIIYGLSTGCQTSWPMTINPLPNPIGGLNNVCEASSIFLTGTPGTGTWSSGSAAIASVLSSGMVTGNVAGNTNITYTLPTGCKRSTPMLVNPRPAIISGNPLVCEASCIALSDFTAGGTWTSDAPFIASVDPSTGQLCGVAQGNTNISYTLSTGCARAVTATINGLPAVITGAGSVCKDQTTPLASTTPGGTWSSSNSGIASVDILGTVTGVSQGNANITYALTTGCSRVANMVVNPLPAAISGNNSVCEQSTTTFTDATTGGTWSSLAAAIADVNPTSGVVTGMATGNTTIIFTITSTGCTRTKDIIVNPAPAAVGGPTNVCQGAAITMTDATAGGTWSVSPAAVANINTAGTLTGIGNGSSTINATVVYTLPEGCTATKVVAVNPLPALISGPSSVCKNLVSPLSDVTAGGAWTSNDGSIASVNPLGVVTGNNAGNTLITYSLSTGCYRTRNMVVNPLPAAIIGSATVCAGLNTVFSDPTPGGTWSSTQPGTATVNSAGMVTGLTAGAANIIYTLPTSCLITKSIAVNPQPASITGPSAVCPGLTIPLADASSGGTWLTSDGAIATVDPLGVVTGGTAGPVTITYSLGTGCIKTKNIVVNPAPAPITGNTNVCIGYTTSFGDASLGGTWSSSTPAVGIISASSGVATGTGPGFTIITYTLPTGCINTTSLVVNALPSVITGTRSVCAGSITALGSADAGGNWSAASAVASIDQSGNVTGVAAGTTTITYSFGTGCQRTTIVTVNALPELITGSAYVCPGSTTILNDDKVGGTWSIDNITTANIDPTSGVVNGVNPGTTTVTYTLPTGCLRTRMITVNDPVAPITGATSVCAGLSTTLASASADGVWSSGNTAVATIDPATGVAHGITAGNASVTYTVPTGCMATTMINVNALPPSIAGTTHVCAGSAANLTNAQAGGTWTSGDVTKATISATGMVTGLVAGNVPMTYTLGNGCFKTTTMVVNPLPQIDTVNGGGSYCAGGAGMHIGLKGSQTGTTYKLYNAASSMIASLSGTGLAADFGLFGTPGTYTVAATTSNGCISNMQGNALITVTPLTVPSVAITATADTACLGAAITYSATPTNGGTPTYAWHVSGGSTAGTGSSFTVTPASGDVITVDMTSTVVCPLTPVVTAMKQPVMFAVLTPSVSIAATPGNKVCQGATATFFASPTAGGTNPVYSWVAGGTIQAGVTGPEFSYVPKPNDAVHCTLVSSYRCASPSSVSSNNITMTVDSIYIPAVSIIATPGTEIYHNTTVTFTTTVTKAGSNPTYQWLKNGQAIGGATAPTYVGSNFSDGDSVTCEVTGTGACGYKTINSVELHVLPGNATGIVPATTANSNITLMPNPNNGGFMIRGALASADDQEVSLEVTDVLGQVVYTARTMAQNGNINEKIQLGSNVANGMYILNIRTAGEHATFHFVVKQ